MGLHGGIRVVRSQAVVVQSKEEAADRFPPEFPSQGFGTHALPAAFTELGFHPSPSGFPDSGLTRHHPLFSE